MNNVCHISSVHKVFDTRIFFKECKSLAEAGYNVSLIVTHDKEETVDGVRIIPFPVYKSRIKRFIFSSIRMFRMARKQKAGIYHFHDPELLITGLLLRFFTKSKIIYDIHDNYTYSFLTKPYIKFRAVRVILSKAFYYFEKWVSRSMAANIVTIPGWVDKYPKAVLVRNFPILETVEGKKDANLFTYVGSLGSSRCALEMILIFIELEKMMPGIKFDIIGNFVEKPLEKKVMEHIKTCPAIHYMGYRPFSEAQNVLACAAYGFVLYSDTKTRGNLSVKLLEYLANDVVSIFSSGDEFEHEIEGEGWGIAVDPQNPVEAARKIYEVIMDEEKRRALVENVKRYKFKYSWESEKKELLNLYDGLDR